MKQLYYVFQSLLHGRGTNVIKIISLTLGITVSILIFAREAFELNFDTCYDDYERLCAVKVTWVINNEKDSGFMTLGPTAAAIAESFPNEVESATATLRWWGSNTLFRDDMRFTPGFLVGDTCFIKTMGVKVLSGNQSEMANPDVIFISKSFAEDVFADKNPVGEVLKYNKNMPMTVKGVFEDFPENSSFYGSNVLMSMATVDKYEWSYWGWDGGDSYFAYVRLYRAADMEKVNKLLPKMVEKYLPEDADASGVKYEVELIPITRFRIENDFDGSNGMIWIMIILGTIILFTVTLNYVLSSISSMSQRAKAVGIHKCNGADAGTIFGMFLWETSIVVFVSLLCMAFLLLNFQDMLEDMIGVTLKTLFSVQNIWAPACVVLFLFIIGGVLPGHLFSRIPVTQVFRRYSQGKKGWKRPLLFVQFTGMAFIFSLLALVLIQSHHITSRDRGYDIRRVAYTYFTFSHEDNARSTILNLPYVESAASCAQPLSIGLSGTYVTADGGNSVSIRVNSFDKEYLPFAGIKLKAGRNIEKGGDLLVNEAFLKTLHWEENPIGRQVKNNDYTYGNIVGVLEDFVTGNPAYVGIQPLIVLCKNQFNGCVQIRLKEPFDENLERLNKDMRQIYPHGDIVFDSAEKVIGLQNRGVTNFRNAILLAAITIFFIALMGLIGYVADEIQRRSKEIAIRKVNGATVLDILSILINDILLTALPAVVIGTIGAWYVGSLWMDQFFDKVAYSGGYYMLIALLALALIIGCVVVKSWRIANENPVNSIKSE